MNLFVFLWGFYEQSADNNDFFLNCGPIWLRLKHLKSVLLGFWGSSLHQQLRHQGAQPEAEEDEDCEGGWGAAPCEKEGPGPGGGHQAFSSTGSQNWRSQKAKRCFLYVLSLCFIAMGEVQIIVKIPNHWASRNIDIPGYKKIPLNWSDLHWGQGLIKDDYKL